MSTLNTGQQKAFMEILAFLNDPTRKTHRVSGGAGTGKTFLISHISDTILRHTNESVNLVDVAITATTNKAAAVLSGAMPHRRNSIETIHSFMNLRLSQNYNTGEQRIVPTRNWVVHDRILIIVDEASMVNTSLMEYILKGTTENCKILFVGDKNQLAPVKESLSPVYSMSMGESLLTQAVRNAEQPALMELCEKCVNTVKTGEFFKIEEVPGVIDFVNGNQLQGILERDFTKDDPMRRILCYTNERVLEYNNFVREIRGFDENYNVGETMANNQSAVLPDKTRLYTDQILKVIDKGSIYNDSNIVSGHDVPMIPVSVEDLYSGATYDFTCFAEPEDRVEVLRHFKSMKRWEKFYKTQEQHPDLRSVAASTTHKAQGSTYGEVIVDLGDISKSTNIEQTARLLYVGLSRPKSRLFIRGELAPRYFK